MYASRTKLEEENTVSWFDKILTYIYPRHSENNHTFKFIFGMTFLRLDNADNYFNNNMLVIEDKQIIQL